MTKYTPTNWQDALFDEEGNRVQKGTALSADNLNKIEQGVATVDGKVEAAQTAISGLPKRSEFDAVTQELAEIVGELNNRIINVMQPPNGLATPKADGVSDDTSALQAISNYAYSIGSSLYFPENEYRIKGTLEVYTDITSDGVFITDISDGGTALIVKSKKEEKTIVASELTGLLGGSRKIGGLPEISGASLFLESTEELIRRDNAPSYMPYTLTDSFIVMDNTGRVHPELDTTYTDLSKITATYRLEEDSVLELRGVCVVYTGVNDGERRALLINRSDVVLNDCKVINRSPKTARTLISTHRANNITFNNLESTGARSVGYGYGVSVGNCSFLYFNDCIILDCRHAITGRHSKALKIRGGIFMDSVDSHWGLDFDIQDALIYDRVGFCGKDISVSGCTFYSTYYALNIRHDTPEVRGYVKFTDCTVYSDSEYLDLFKLSARKDFDWGREMRTPDNIVVKDITVKGVVPKVSLYSGSEYRIPHKHPTNLTFDNITAVNGGVISFLVECNEQHLPTTETVRIEIKNIRQPDEHVNGMIIREWLQGDKKHLFDVSFEKCYNVKPQIDSNVISSVVFSECVIVGLNRFNPKTVRLGDVKIYNSKLTGVLSGSFYLMIYNSVFYGNITSEKIDIFNNLDDRIKIAKGNEIELDVAYTPLEKVKNYANPLFYKV